MWPRLWISVVPVERERGTYRVRVGKGWWGGPGTGARTVVLAEFHISTSATTEGDRIREALRAAADAYPA